MTDSHKHLGTLLLRVQRFSAGSLNLRGGRTSLKEEERSERPTSVVTEENISAVEALIKEDPRRTYKDIKGALGISSPSVSIILHQHLRVRKIFFLDGCRTTCQMRLNAQGWNGVLNTEGDSTTGTPAGCQT